MQYQVVDFMAPIFGIGAGKEVVLSMVNGVPTCSSITQDDIDATTIEVYDFICCLKSEPIKRPKQTKQSKKGKRGQDATHTGASYEEPAPGNMAPIQQILDGMMGPWKGRVLIKNRDECPPCPACDYSRVAEYADVVAEHRAGQCDCC